MMATASNVPPKNSGRFGSGNPGKPKGAVTKTGKLAREAIAAAAEALGGEKRLALWVKEDAKNEHAFWTTIYPKLIPVQVEGPGPNGSHVFERIVREVVEPK